LLDDVEVTMGVGTKLSAVGTTRSNGFAGRGSMKMEPLSTITATSPISWLSASETEAAVAASRIMFR
jgi:hypothetical protein